MNEETAKEILTLLKRQSREFSDLRNMLGAVAAEQVKISQIQSKFIFKKHE